MSRVILASNRLPVRIDASGQFVRTTGGLASALAGAELRRETLWVGWPGRPAEEIKDPDAERSRLAELNLRPVFLTRDDLESYYEGFSNATLWPLLHYLPDRARFSDEWAASYLEVNHKFAEEILSVAEDGDVVWIHDYHLFALPAMLRAAGRRLKIGFFLHTPFPSSDVLRILPWRAELLTGMLGADIVGFHTYNYLRHFRSSLLRLLGIESEIDSLWHEGRSVRMRVYPIGHDHRGFAQAMAEPEFETLIASHSDVLRGRKLILSVERLDYTKGVPQKLAAIRRFLADRPHMREKVAFVIIAVPSRRGVEGYDLLTEDVQRQVGAINGEFGTVGHSPIQFLHRGFPPVELAALYALADVCLVTPLIDGMNLVAKEFVGCQLQTPDRPPGALILSEFAGAAQELSHALLVNPYDEGSVAEAIAQALAMDERERRDRINAMRPRLIANDAGSWARLCIDELDREPVAETGVQLTNVVPLAEGLAATLKSGGQVAVILDYDGTLRGFTDQPHAAVPDAGLVPLLTRLALIPQLKLAIVSGRPGAFLEHHLGSTGATLVAEHGYRWRLENSEEWSLVHGEIDTSWKEAIRAQLEHAMRLTPGSHIEEKQVSLVWHYRQTDPEFGPWRAHGLLAELTELAANLPVSVHHGNKIIEASSVLVSKGHAVEQLLLRWRPDEALVAGDDQTDETMFAIEPKLKYHTIKVGTGSTRARQRTDIAGLRELLEALDRWSGL